MKPIVDDGEYYTYRDLIDSFEVEVLFQEDDDDYQGDSRLLLADGERRGLLTFGWGSCSGCDSLQSAGNNTAELTELRDQLWSQIHWEDTAAALAEYMQSKDWTLDFACDKSFNDAVLALLAGVHR